MKRIPGLAALALVAGIAVGACTNPDRPSVQADSVLLPTPLASYDASVSATIGQLQAAVTGMGNRLDTAVSAYRPSEPASLLQVPRVVMRADLADPDDGYVIIYEAADPDAARQRAQELADYLGSGFGQTNFSADTQFSVSVLGDTVVSTNWSRRRSSDPERTEAVFDALASVGESFKVQK